jgi:hypothetical protein
VKEDAFFTILSLHGVTLSQEEQQKLKKQFTKAGKIDYIAAIQTLTIDLDSAIIKEEKWTTLDERNEAKAREA